MWGDNNYLLSGSVLLDFDDKPRKSKKYSFIWCRSQKYNTVQFVLSCDIGVTSTPGPVKIYFTPYSLSDNSWLQAVQPQIR